MPKKQILQNVWEVVRKDLSFDSESKEGDDVKCFLSSLL